MNKYIVLLFTLLCICLVVHGASRQRREEDGLEEFQKRLSEGFDSVKKAAEEMVAKVDFKQLQQDLSSKLDEFAKSFNDFTTRKEKEEVPAA